MRRSALLVLAFALVFMVGSRVESEAYPQNRGNCSWGETITWYFGSGSGGAFTTSQKARIRDGIDDWLQIVGAAGNQTITSITESGSGDFAITKEANLGRDGSTYCIADGNEGLKLSNTLSLEKFRDVAAHEMGHHLEMWETGAYDHFGGSEPSYMGICEEVSSGQALSQDDWGHATHKWGGATHPSLHANIGFEAGTLWWGKSGVSDFSATTADPYAGDWHLRWRPSVSNGYVYQTMNYVNAGGKKVDAQTAFKKVSSSATTGVMRMHIMRETIDYASIVPGSCEENEDTGLSRFQAGDYIDQNFREYLSGFVVMRGETFTPTTTWQVATEGNKHTFSGSHEGFNVRIRIRSEVKYTSSGALALIDIDNTRVRDRG